MEVIAVDGDVDRLISLEKEFIEEMGKDIQFKAFSSFSELFKHLELGRADCLILSNEVLDFFGNDLVNYIKNHSNSVVSVLVLCNEGGQASIAEYLSTGADECIVRPFTIQELFIRIERLYMAVASRLINQEKKESPFFAWLKLDKKEHYLHGITFDDNSLTVTAYDKTVKLSFRQYALAVFLFKNVGQNLPREHILQNVPISSLNRSLAAQVCLLRKKLKFLEEKGFYINSLYGFGYRLDKFAINNVRF